MSFIVAIDGPSGTGKGTVTSELARKLNLVYLDTGAMYRCVTLKLLNEKIDFEDTESIKNAIKNMKMELNSDKIMLDGVDVTRTIREDPVNSNVSQVSHIVEVRQAMVELQRKMSEGKEVILEGRDIGTNVFPNADIKFYLDASTDERVKRRLKQNQEKGIKCTEKEVRENIEFRDNNDKNSKVGPLRKAEDAIYVDTTNMAIKEVEKLYITPEIKRKKKLYKFEFFISLVVVCVLSSYYIYAEYNKNKDEAVSQEILAGANIVGEDQTTKPTEKLVVMLDNDVNTVGTEDDSAIANLDEETKSVLSKEFTTADGHVYKPIATIRIPKINIYYPVLSETTEELLKKAPTKFMYGEPNEVGNFCIAGHNYRNKKFFSKVPTLENGDIIEITDTKGRTVKYTVYNKYTVTDDDMSPVSQLTNGRKDITLITCTDDSKERVIVKATEVL